jgi:hypothetical protein
MLAQAVNVNTILLFLSQKLIVSNLKINKYGNSKTIQRAAANY